MKKITAFITALLLILNLFSFSAFALGETVTIDAIDYGEGKTSFNIGDTAKITGTCTEKKDLVLRLYDEKGAMIYTDVIYASDNDGTFEFDGIVIPDTDSTGTLSYKAYISITGNNSAYEQVVKINGKTELSPTPGPGPGPGPKTDPINICEKCGWETCRCNEPEDTSVDEVGKAYNHTENYEIIAEAAKQKTPKAGAAMIDIVTKATSPEALAGEAARNTIAMSVEAMMANISSKKISTTSSTNKLVLKESSISDADLKK